MFPGEPLSSLQIDPIFNKYRSEMIPEEITESQNKTDRRLFEFIKKHLDEI
jgi:hypothetical protein